MTPALLASEAPAEIPLAGAPIAGLWLLVLVPLVGAAVLLLGGRRTDRSGAVLGTLVSTATLVLAVLFVAELLGRPETEQSAQTTLFSWVPVGGFDVSVGLLLDRLSALFVLLITGVGTLVHVYSIGYMAHDPDRRRFFAYLNLFLAAMLLLVLADDFLVLYVGWEGVGLASYLLIGFWYGKPSAATAAKKAFVVNRVGDVGLSIAIMVMFATLGTVSFAGVFEGASALSDGALLAVCLLLLLAACGKSAQFPLHVWLADAMEGPTPASALIHAATMVTAGVYLVARCNPLYDLSEAGQIAVAVVGAVTLLLGAVLGCAEDDLKRVLAYSTVSQIGFMMLAVGLGPLGYAIGIFHLLTHGFFKAALFMGAGSVMHAMGDQVDMRRFGGLRRALPLTFLTMMAGYLAIIGFPGTSGFFSKELIIEAAFERHVVLGAVALLGAAITAFYMTRLMVMTFFGPKRWTEGQHPHEAPVSMTAPMLLLGVLALVGGALLEFVFEVTHFLEPVLGVPEHADPVLGGLALTAAVVVATLLAVALAIRQFSRREVPLEPPTAGPLVHAARERLYADAFYESTLMRPGQYLTRALVFADAKGVDGAVNGVSATIGGLSSRLGRLQNGFVRTYALTILGGAAVVLAVMLLARGA